jgi:hypothetical protein
MNSSDSIASPPGLDLSQAPKNLSFAGELWLFVQATGKWWLVPLLLVLILLGAAIALSASPYAPFLYSLF